MFIFSVWLGSDGCLRYVLCLVESEGEGVSSTSRCEADSTPVVFPLARRLLLDNATLYLHAYLSTVNGAPRTAELHTKLNRFMPPPQPEKYKNLLESNSEERAEVERLRKEHEKRPWISYWKVNWGKERKI